MSIYDHIFIGSSPLFLMCHNEVNKTQNSLLLEQSTRIGGAWYTTNIWGIHNLELGCHILKNNPLGYKLMEAQGATLKEMKLQPSILLCKLQGESALNYVKNITLRTSRIFSSNKLITKHKVQKLEQLLRKRESCPHRYLDLGCYQLIQELSAKSRNLEQDKTVQEISFEEDFAVVTLVNGDSYRAKHVHIPRNCLIPKFTFADKSIEPDYDDYVSEHYILKLNKQKKEFSFIECIGDELLNLVSNVSLYVKDSEHLILAVAVKKPSSVPENNLVVTKFEDLPDEAEQKSTVELIMNKLKAFKVIEKNNELLDFHYEPYLLKPRVNNPELNEHIKKEERLSLHDTTDLIESVINSPILNAN